ncbi:hypothetical protein [Pseudomonas sp. Marseille-Q8238]
MSQIDPQHRQAVLDNPQALDCTVYRPDESDLDAEEIDLGDAKVLLAGPFVAPADWDAQEREDFFGDSDPDLFVTAYLECEAKPGSAAYFQASVGDYIATMSGAGEVVMYFVEDYRESDKGRLFILLRDDQTLD